MVRPLIIDGRNMFSRETLTEHGFEYVDFGRRATGGKVAAQLPEA